MKENLITTSPIGRRVIEIEGATNQSNWIFTDGVHLTSNRGLPCYVFDGSVRTDYIRIPYSNTPKPL